jgi:hypothetical protein
MFLMTYTYIEAKSNYHRGSILILRSVPSRLATYRSDRQVLATSSSLRVSTSRLPRQLTSTKAISIIVLVHFKSSQLFLFPKRCGGTFHPCDNMVTRSHIVRLHAHKRLSAIWLPPFYHHELYPFSHHLWHLCFLKEIFLLHLLLMLLSLAIQSLSHQKPFQDF